MRYNSSMLCESSSRVNGQRKLRFLIRGQSLPDSNWLNQALAALGHAVIESRLTPAECDVLLVHDPSAATVREVEAARRTGILTILRSWRDPETLEAAGSSAAGYDWVVTTGLAGMVNAYASVGVRAVTLLPSAPPLVSPRNPRPRDYDIIFAGRLTGPERKLRLDFLRRAASKWKVAVITDDAAAWNGAHPLAASRLEEFHRRARLTLHTDRIALNRFGVTRGCPARRPFFGPAFGCVLLAELRPWLLHCFDPASEMAGFADEEQAICEAAALLEDPQRMESIAAAGAERVRADHLPERRARQLVTLASGTVPAAMQVLALGPWYQQIELPGGEKTCLLEHSNVKRWQRLKHMFPDVRGRSVLDLGMNAGFFSLECVRRGSTRVCGVERSPLSCAQARFVFDLWRTNIVEVLERDILEAPAGPFDVCLALALLHHFENIGPLLRIATERCREVVLEWGLREGSFYHPIEDVTNWFKRAGWNPVVVSEGVRPIVIARADGHAV